MNEKIIHSFEGICPLTSFGVYGIKKTFNMPNFPCADTIEQMSLKKHLMYKHNLSNTAANKIVLEQMSAHQSDEKKCSRKHELIFNNTQELFSHSVHWHKGRCPFSYGFHNVFNLTSASHQIKNYNCRHVKQCLLLSHLRVSHNLNIKSAKKIVKTMMSSAIENQHKSSIENDIQEIILFQKDDAVINTNPNIYNDDRRFRHYCPLSSILEDLSEQSLLNVPCNKSNEKFILFAHLQHYHQMSGELALRLIRSIRTNLESSASNEQTNSNSKASSSINPTVTDDMDIVPYKCLCPYSTTSDNRYSNLLKKFTRLVKNIPCDRPCPVNLYRHLRNYHKVDLQHAKEITRTIMLRKTIKSDEDPSSSNVVKKRVKLPKISTNFETTISLVRLDLSTVNPEIKNETVDLFIGNENPDDWDSSMINDDESLFLAFDEERLNFDVMEPF